MERPENGRIAGGQGSRALSIVSWGSCALASLSAAGLSLLIVVQRKSFAEIFRDMATKLPLLTQWFLAIPGVVFLAAGVLLIALLLVKEFLVRNKAITLALNVVAFLFLVSVLVVFREAMLLPMVALCESLQK